MIIKKIVCPKCGAKYIVESELGGGLLELSINSMFKNGCDKCKPKKSSK